MLTRERLQNAKNIRSMAPTAVGRFDHLTPVICELWHVKQDLLAVIIYIIYKMYISLTAVKFQNSTHNWSWKVDKIPKL